MKDENIEELEVLEDDLNENSVLDDTSSYHQEDSVASDAIELKKEEYRAKSNQAGFSLDETIETNSFFPSNVGSDISHNISMENSDVSNRQELKHDVKTSRYIGYESRVGMLVLLILVLFGIACFLVFKALSYESSRNITYNEVSSMDYQVCLNSNEYYQEECIGSGMEYLSLITKNIPVSFNYVADYSSNIDYDYQYYVTSTIKIYKQEEPNKVLYQSNETLLKKKKLKGTGDTIQFSDDVVVPFSEYNDYVNGYKSKYSLSSDSVVEVYVYLEGKDGPKKVGGLTIPLSTQTYSITKDELLNQNLVATSIKNSWKNANVFYAIMACVFSLVGIFVFIRLILFVTKVRSHENLFQKKLNQILREYDRIIVEVSDTDSFVGDKKVVKVRTFLELLDARDTLEKPIVHIKINNVKSEFYVEDVDKVYKFVMKEADFDSKK